MKLLQETFKSVYAKYLTTTMWTSDAIPFYIDHVPNAKSYPIICFYHISTNNFMAMPNTVQPSGFDYIDSRFQFSVYGNDKQYSQIMDITDRLEDTYHRKNLVYGNNCTFIAMFTIDSTTKFFDEQQKIWTITQDYRILAGK